MANDIDLIELIRTKPAMYVGRGSAGLHHLVSRSLDSFSVLNPATSLELQLRDANTLSIRAATERFDFERALSVLGRAMSQPWHPIDFLMLVACYSDTFVLGGTKAPQAWASKQGRKSDDVPVPPPTADVELHLKADTALFDGAQLDFDHLSAGLRMRAALTPGLLVSLKDEQGRALVLRYPQGLVNFVREEAGLHVDLPEPLAIDRKWNQLRVRVALQWVKPSDRAAVLPRIWSSFNGHRTRGGAHHRGVIKAIGKWKRQSGTSQDGLVCAVAVDGWGGGLEGELRDVWECDGFEAELAKMITEALAAL